MKDPDTTLAVIEDVGLDEKGNGRGSAPPYRVFFGKQIAFNSQKGVTLAKLGLKNGRNYLGPTSMDAEISLLMANLGCARPGSLLCAALRPIEPSVVQVTDTGSVRGDWKHPCGVRALWIEHDRRGYRYASLARMDRSLHPSICTPPLHPSSAPLHRTPLLCTLPRTPLL